MSSAIQALNVVLPLAYLLAAILHGVRVGDADQAPLARLRHLLIGLAVGMHLAVFLLHWRSSGTSPLFDPWITLSAVAFFLATLYLATSMRAAKLGGGGAVLLVVALMQLFASAFGPMEGYPETDPIGPVTFVHSITGAAAVGALLLSALHGSLFLIVLRRMKRRKFGPIVRRLPSLHALARLMRRAALIGFLFLGVGINFGIGWAHFGGMDTFRYTDPWVLMMIVLWIYSGVVAFSRLIPGFSAQRASIAAAAGGLCLLATTIVTAFPAVSFHWNI
jgi:ABC-type uncharacterized transport system permease subunit